jgi:glycerophosphoryl diester phosphodiesterase
MNCYIYIEIIFCRAFEEYVRCVEPDLGVCDDKRFVLIHRYETEKSKYVGKPYNCSLPNIKYNYEKWVEITTPSSMVYSSCGSPSNNFITVILLALFGLSIQAITS